MYNLRARYAPLASQALALSRIVTLCIRVNDLEDLDSAGMLAATRACVQVDLGLTKEIMASAPGQEVLSRGIPMIGESGIFTPEHVQYVQDAGCKGILVGESIVKGDDFEGAVKTLLAR